MKKCIRLYHSGNGLFSAINQNLILMGQMFELSSNEKKKRWLSRIYIELFNKEKDACWFRSSWVHWELKMYVSLKKFINALILISCCKILSTAQQSCTLDQQLFSCRIIILSKWILLFLGANESNFWLS